MAVDHNNMTYEQARMIIQANQSTLDSQAKALEALITRLTTLADKLEPLVPVVEGMIAGMDGQVGRMETVTAANAKVGREMRQLYLVEKEEQTRREQPLV